MNEPDIHIDNRCWARLLKGDKEALFELYQRYYHTLLFIGLKQIRDADLVKDVIQQQFLYFWEKRASLFEARNVKSYIIISFLRRLTNDWVKARRTKSLEVAWSHREDEFVETSCEELLIIKDHHEAVSRNLITVINALPVRQRELIMLKFYEGLGYNAIAKKTGLTHRTIYNKIHEALGKIRQRLLQTAAASGINLLIFFTLVFFEFFFD